MITLFQHQQQALDLTEGHNRCAYYLDMGLGKTFVGSEKALTLNSRVNLLICQCSKVSDWIDHMVENYAMNHCWMIYDLTNKKEFDWFMAAVAETDNPTRICGVINYELTFRRKILKTLSGFTLMLDESSLIQNENAKRSKFILGLNPDNVILLSGTPTGGKYEKLWSQCRLLGWNISKELFWKQYIETEWVEEDGFWRQKITGYKNVDRLKKKLAEHGAVFMTTDDAGIDLPKRNFVPVRTPPAKEYWKFWRERAISINTATLQEFELDSDFWGSNESYERELIGDTSLTRRLYARQLCGLYNPNRYKAFRELVESTEDRLIVFYKETIWAGYNSRHYDQFILKGILCGFNPKKVNDWIILDDKPGYRFSSLFRNFPLINYDVMPNPPISLKALEAFMGHSIKETTVPFDIDRPLTEAELAETVKYCRHDVEETVEVWVRNIAEFNTTMFFVNHFHLGSNSIGKTKAQLAAEILGGNGKGKSFDDEFDFPILDCLRLKKYRFVADWYKNPVNHDYGKAQENITVAGVRHTFAWGGGHGAIPKYHAHGIFLVIDVTAYYPSLQKQFKIGYRVMDHPENFEFIHDSNIEFKRKGDMLKKAGG